MATGVYIIQNLYNGKTYIGSAVDIKRRRRDHFKSLQDGCHKNGHLQSAWDKYGESSFEFKVLSKCQKRSLIRKEQQAIDVFIQDYGQEMLYNICLVAGSSLGRKFSLESRAKMSESQKGRKHSPETKARIGEAGKGRKHSSKTRAKMSKAAKGKKRIPLSSEHKAKLSEVFKGRLPWNTGRKLSKEHRAKISKGLEGNQYLKGYKHTSEARAKMSKVKRGNQYSKGYKHTPETKAKMSVSQLKRWRNK